MAGPRDLGRPKGLQGDLLAVDAPDPTACLDDQFHDYAPSCRMGRMIFRRGRSTIIPSIADCTLDNSMTTRCRRSPSLRRSWAATPRTACCAWATRASSWSLLRTLSDLKRSKNSPRL